MSSIDLLKPALGLFLVVGVFVWVPVEQRLQCWKCVVGAVSWSECIPFESQLSVRFLDGVFISIRLQSRADVHRVVKVAYSTVAGCALPPGQARRTLFP